MLWLRSWGFPTVSPSHPSVFPHHGIQRITVEFSEKSLAVKFVDKEHAITRGLGDWTTINEELYNNASGKLEPTAHPLASGTQVYTKTESGKEVTAEAVVAWTNTYNGKTKVFATTLGHNNATVDDPRYLDLVTRGLLWSLGKLDAEHLKAVQSP